MNNHSIKHIRDGLLEANEALRIFSKVAIYGNNDSDLSEIAILLSKKRETSLLVDPFKVFDYSQSQRFNGVLLLNLKALEEIAAVSSIAIFFSPSEWADLPLLQLPIKTVFLDRPTKAYRLKRYVQHEIFLKEG